MESKLKGVKAVRILLADDDLQMLSMVHRLLEADFDVIEAVSDGQTLVEAAFKLRPDIIVTDISMPVMTGLEAVRQIRSVMPEIKCIFLTMHGTRSYRLAAQKAGASGYVLKSSARKELNEEIRRALEACD